MSDFEKLINASDLIEWIMEAYPDWCVGAIRSIVDHVEALPSAQPEIIHCKDCKNSKHWYRDRRRCFIWAEEGVSVFDDGFCNYAERVTNG